MIYLALWSSLWRWKAVEHESASQILGGKKLVCGGPILGSPKTLKATHRLECPQGSVSHKGNRHQKKSEIENCDILTIVPFYIISGILSDIDFHIPSDIKSNLLSASIWHKILSGTHSNILSRINFDILADINCDTLSDVDFDILHTDLIFFWLRRSIKHCNLLLCATSKWSRKPLWFEILFLGFGSTPWSGLCHWYEGKKFAHNIHVPFTFCSLVLKPEVAYSKLIFDQKRAFQKQERRTWRFVRFHAPTTVYLIERAQNVRIVQRTFKRFALLHPRSHFCATCLPWISFRGLLARNVVCYAENNFFKIRNEICLVKAHT